MTAERRNPQAAFSRVATTDVPTGALLDELPFCLWKCYTHYCFFSIILLLLSPSAIHLFIVFFIHSFIGLSITSSLAIHSFQQFISVNCAACSKLSPGTSSWLLVFPKYFPYIHQHNFDSEKKAWVIHKNHTAAAHVFCNDFRLCHCQIIYCNINAKVHQVAPSSGTWRRRAALCLFALNFSSERTKIHPLFFTQASNLTRCSSTFCLVWYAPWTGTEEDAV